MRGRRLFLGVLLAILAFHPAPAFAHSAPFSYLDLTIGSEVCHGTLVIHEFDAAHDLGPGYRERLIWLMDSRLTISADGRVRTVEWTGLEALPDRQSVRLTFRFAGAAAGLLRVEALLFPYDSKHQTFVNVYENGTLRQQAVLNASHTAVDYYTGSAQGAWAV